jgi:hypothetical protein
MKIMNMELVGDGVYLMGWGKNVFQPKQISRITHGTLGSVTSEEAVDLLIEFSVKHNAWCGVEWSRLMRELRKKCKEDWEFEGQKRAIEMMVRDGLLEIPTKYKSWYARWMNAFSPTIVCPTNLLVNTIWTKQAH